MDNNLIEIGFKPGDIVYHVVKGVVGPDGTVDYEPYSDEWLTADEWSLLMQQFRYSQQEEGG